MLSSLFAYVLYSKPAQYKDAYCGLTEEDVTKGPKNYFVLHVYETRVLLHKCDVN